MRQYQPRQDPAKTTPSSDVAYRPATKAGTEKHEFPLGPLSSGHDFGRMPVYAPRDATFVKVETGEEHLRRLMVLNRQAEKELEAKRLEAQGTFKPGPVEQKAKEDEAAQKILKDQFGDGWGAVFWWTRGGGQTGEDSPLWQVLEAGSGMNRNAAPRVDRTPNVYRTESTR
ncbi:hypothetical protein [Longimicrobium sp.]|uniref:hypothetical protein n=1 Tax=Longimicrobium sp. TaxID=2029185 RepID=UPI002D0BA590|nr:hypothetical protein [Longimicrobium sp.]HSU15025.1 hypothetical protein [Longimicrobium sp.]